MKPGPLLGDDLPCGVVANPLLGPIFPFGMSGLPVGVGCLRASDGGGTNATRSTEDLVTVTGQVTLPNKTRDTLSSRLGVPIVATPVIRSRYCRVRYHFAHLTFRTPPPSLNRAFTDRREASLSYSRWHLVVPSRMLLSTAPQIQSYRCPFVKSGGRIGL